MAGMALLDVYQHETPWCHQAGDHRHHVNHGNAIMMGSGGDFDNGDADGGDDGSGDDDR